MVSLRRVLRSGKIIFLGFLLVPVGSALPTPPPEAELPPLRENRFPTPAYQRQLEVRAETKRLVEENDTAGLEALADQLRESKARLDGGTWMLSSFYSAADDFPEGEEESAVRFFQSWVEKNPESITARVCLVNALTSYAWAARGTGWADSVTDEGWRLMGERLDEANRVIAESADLKKKCPGMVAAAQKVALGQGWDTESYMDMVTSAIQAEPSYGKYYTNTCYWLTPRWNGEPGDIARWIAKIADGYPPEKRDRQYAFMVWMADLMPVKGELIFEPDQLDWERTKRGFQEWIAEKPDNLMIRFQFIRLALLADDRDAVREQFDVTGGEYFPRMWSGPEQFEAARTFAYGDGPNPLWQEAVPTTPKITPEALAIISVVFRHLGGFFGGAIAGIALFILALQRKRVWAGVIAFIASLILGAAFGTLATLLPAGILYLYVRRQNFLHPPDIAAPSAWIILLWALLLPAINVGLQIAAGILAFVPLFFEYGFTAEDQITQVLMSNGTLLLIAINGCWIALLALVIVCRPRSTESWKNILGLNSCSPIAAGVWAVLTVLFLFGFGFVTDPFMDEHSRNALKLMSFGIQSPIVFYAALVLVAPLVEELIFRGYIYSGWINKIGFWRTAVASSLIFAVSHLQYGLVALIYVFILGMTLASLRWKTGSSIPGIAVHALNNLGFALSIQFLTPPI